jgi:ACR3 family arsenite transporter
MILSSTEVSHSAHTEPFISDKDADSESLQLEEQTALKNGSVIKGLGWLDCFLAV